MIPRHAQVDKGVDFWKRMRGHYIDCVQEGLWGVFATTCGKSETGKEDDQEDEAVFATVKGDGEFIGAGEWGL